MITEKLLLNVIDEISMGPFGSNIKVDNFISSGVPVLNGANLADKKLTEKTFNFISEEKANSLGKANARAGDIVITHRGTLGQVSYIPKDSKYDRYVISQSQFRVRFKSEINPIYITYLFHTEYGQKKLLSFKNHVGVPALAQATSNFKSLKLRMHDKVSQDKIANVLATLDEKIERNHKINDQLEVISKTLYDYWFVQFDFPDEKDQPYKSSGGKMLWNEVLKRELPRKWDDGKLHEIANITMGQSPPGKSYNENGDGMIFFQGSTDFGNRFPSIRQFTSAPSRFAKEGDILLSVRAPVGTLNIAKEDCCIGRGLAALNSKDNCISYLLGVMINLKQIFDRRNVDGTTFGSITKDDLYSLKIVKPDKETLEKYNSIISHAFQKQNKLNLENIKLAELRDWLLPMLMNGQVSVGKINEQKEKVSMAAEPETTYSKIVRLTIPKNKLGFAKQVLAGKIVSLFKADKNFTHVKFQKLQFLAEHIAEADLNLNYYFQTAGPYDNRFMHTIADSFRKSKWFNEKDYKFLSLEKENEIDKYYAEYFTPVNSQLSCLFKLLSKVTVAETEIIATVYAVWNNRLILKQPIKNTLLIENFYNWSDRKRQYNKKEILDAVQWLKKNGFAPKGFGKEIKRAKRK